MRAQSHPDADLLSSLCDCVRHQTEQPHHRNLTLPWFDVHQNADNFLMNGGQSGQERCGSESAVHR